MATELCDMYQWIISELESQNYVMNVVIMNFKCGW